MVKRINSKTLMGKLFFCQYLSEKSDLRPINLSEVRRKFSMYIDFGHREFGEDTELHRELLKNELCVLCVFFARSVSLFSVLRIYKSVS